MSNIIPLYHEEPGWVIEDVDELDLKPTCDLCSRCKSAKNPLLKPKFYNPYNSTEDPVLVVLPTPMLVEDSANMSCSSQTHIKLEHYISRVTTRPLVITYAVQCYGKNKPTARQLLVCRGYLANILFSRKFHRVLAFGSVAYESVVGAKASRVGAYSYSRDLGLWIWYLREPAVAFQNRVFRKELFDGVETALNGEPPPVPYFGGNTVIVDTTELTKKVCAELREATWVSIDVETYGIRYKDDNYKILSLAAYGAGQENAYVWLSGALSHDVAGPLYQLLEDPKIKLVGHNIKFDVTAIRHGLGVKCSGVWGDTRLWSKMFDHDQSASLAAMGPLIGMGAHKDEAHEYVKEATKHIRATDKSRAKRAGAYAYAAIPKDLLAQYNARDVVVTSRLVEYYLAKSKEFPTVMPHWFNVVKDAAWAISMIEHWGIPVDKTAVKALGMYLETEKAELAKSFKKYGDFKPDSTHDVAKLLFETLRLKSKWKTPSGRPSVDRNALGKLADQHPVVNKLLMWRKLTKMNGPYVEGLLPFIGKDGRVHPDFLLDGAASGRLSCRAPNLQNIPRAATQLGKMIRTAFVAPPGKIFVQADYSTLELRVAAFLCQDEAMCEVFRSGVDYHKRTAQMISDKEWGITPDKVTKVHRTAAKDINFGLLYGKSDYGIAKDLKTTTEEAAKIRNAILGIFPNLAQWIDGELQHARKTGYGRTYWDQRDGENIPTRIRPLRGLGSVDEKQRQSAERASWHTPVQGTASDFCLASIVETVKWVIEDVVPAKVILTVHDSILLEVDEDALDEVCWHLNEIMTSWPSGNVPLGVDIETGYNWSDLKPYELEEG